MMEHAINYITEVPGGAVVVHTENCPACLLLFDDKDVGMPPWWFQTPFFGIVTIAHIGCESLIVIPSRNSLIHSWRSAPHD